MPGEPDCPQRLKIFQHDGSRRGLVKSCPIVGHQVDPLEDTI